MTIPFYPVSRTNELDHEQLVICKCPEWNEEGFQIARWDNTKKEFEYSAQPNEMFHSTVIEFGILSDYGDILNL